MRFFPSFYYRLNTLLFALIFIIAPINKTDAAELLVPVFDTQVIAPLSNWQGDENPDKTSKMKRIEEGPLFILEYVPKEENFSNWSQFYAIQGEINPELNVEEYFQSQLAKYQQGCGEENVDYIIVKADEATQRILSLFFCGSAKNAPKHLGYGENVGEVGLYWFSKTKNTLVKVYHLWRGERFVFNTAGSWHTDIPGVRDQIQKMSGISINRDQ